MPENEKITHKARILTEIVAEYHAIAGSSTISSGFDIPELVCRGSA